MIPADAPDHCPWFPRQGRDPGVSTLRRSFFDPAIPADLLGVGENVIELQLAEGGWMAWDGAGRDHRVSGHCPGMSGSAGRPSAHS
ncbi:hypothetical protein [Brachybacterium sp. AOP24-D1-21]|uniref:hypothetical protein n=1 Tax=Brachybacterium sp. AOP24-D1-21 TaxID=3457711 RepID=UPI0040332A57